MFSSVSVIFHPISLKVVCHNLYASCCHSPSYKRVTDFYLVDNEEF